MVSAGHDDLRMVETGDRRFLKQPSAEQDTGGGIQVNIELQRKLARSERIAKQDGADANYSVKLENESEHAD